MFSIGICKAKGIPIDDEVEVLHSTPSTEEGTQEEEHELNEHDLDVINNELQAMKKRISSFEHVLDLNLPECPEPKMCIDPEVELNCSKNKEICELQRNNHKLNVQMCELVKCCQMAKSQIQDLRARHCQEMQEIQHLEKLVDKMFAFKLRLEHEFGLCIERFEHLKHVKCEWRDCVEKARQLNLCFEKRSTCHVPKECYVRDRNKVVTYLLEVKRVCGSLHTFITTRLNAIERNLGVKSRAEYSKHLVTAASSALFYSASRFDAMQMKSALSNMDSIKF